MPKISVIVPVYMVEDYIMKCIESLLNQTLEDIEYIFVDDCSQDKSVSIIENIIEKYPKRKNQIKILRHDVNLGVSKSRQDGVDIAQGKYIIHCDPDDWIELDMYEKLYNEAVNANADMVICDFVLNYLDKSIYTSHKIIKNKREVLIGMLQEEIHCSLCNKLIKRELYDDFRFVPGVNLWEDLCMVIRLTSKCRTIEYISEPLYHYQKFNSNSYTAFISDKKINDYVNSIDFLERYLRNNKIVETQYLDHLKALTKISILAYGSKLIQQKYCNLYQDIFKKYRHIKVIKNISIVWKIALYCYSNKIPGVHSVIIMASRIYKKMSK